MPKITSMLVGVITYDGSIGSTPAPYTTVVLQDKHSGENHIVTINRYSTESGLVWDKGGKCFRELEVGDRWYYLPRFVIEADDKWAYYHGFPI